jgi:eukaryotic-like serine/threonine-protein kinase
VATHLAYLKQAGFKGGDHFWITSRSDPKTISWAEAHGIRAVIYNPENNNHSEVSEIVNELGKYRSIETTPLPIVPSTKKERGFILPLPEELERATAEEIRIILNKEASRILSSGDPNRYTTYEGFWKRYGEAIHRGWSVSSTPPRNIFMGMVINTNVAKGGFGTIYAASDTRSRSLAVKILHNAAKDDYAVLQSFRRGVQAMRILSQRQVEGIVPYEAAWEIPPCAVMEYIDGPNLQEAVSAGRLKDWRTRIDIALEVVRIIGAAHSVPEAVLHRDIRPANIMLSDLWSDPESYKVYVLDFDLAWHKDATGQSISITHSVNGYLAPELTSERNNNTRSALVDSYGIGMTLFFMASGRAPLFSESSFEKWKVSLDTEIMHQVCTSWKSLAYRWIRMIYWATRPTQKERWDVGRIQGALKQMQAAIGGPSNVLSAELFAEEIFARSNEGARIYTWDVDRLAGAFEIRTGFRVEIRGDESLKEVCFVCEWMNTGDRQFESVRKYIGPATDSVEAALRAGGWVITFRDTVSSSVRITACISVAKLRKHEGLSSAVKAVNESVEALKINK